jgi:hypothetical protein
MLLRSGAHALQVMNLFDDEFDSGSHNFLERLKLDHSADRAAIRRAYGREVKLLDQELQAEQFQQLRECYETALAWVTHKEWDVTAPQAGERKPDSAFAPLQPDADMAAPSAMSAIVFARLQAIRTRLAEPGALNDVPSWEAEIRERLQDGELLNLDARIFFEGRIAYALANDFNEGQFAFFLAAAASFDWLHDQRRLLQFGHAGHIVNEAIVEHGIYRGQHEQEKAAQRRVFDLMRREAAPDEDQLMRDIITFEQMCERIPALMAMRAPQWKIEQWRKGCLALRAAHGNAAFNVRVAYAPDEDAVDERIASLLLSSLIGSYILYQLASIWLS